MDRSVRPLVAGVARIALIVWVVAGLLLVFGEHTIRAIGGLFGDLGQIAFRVWVAALGFLAIPTLLPGLPRAPRGVPVPAWLLSAFTAGAGAWIIAGVVLVAGGGGQLVLFLEIVGFRVAVASLAGIAMLWLRSRLEDPAEPEVPRGAPG